MARGGKRPGSGRKPGKVSESKLIAKDKVARILAEVDDESLWVWAIEKSKRDGDAKGVTDILKYLTDRRDGKATQNTAVQQVDPIQITYKLDTPTPPVVSPDKPEI